MTTTQERQAIGILIVEDSLTQAQHLARLLGMQANWRIRIAGDGLAALAEMERERPALVISDIAMPGMDGFTLCRRLKDDARFHDLPMVLLTKLSSVGDIVSALASGADAFVRKPYDGPRLVERLHRMLDGAAGGGERPLEVMAAERRQIYELLAASHAEAARLHAELADKQAVLERSCRSLALLGGMAAALNEAVGVRTVAQAALSHLLALPGMAGAEVGIHGQDGAPQVLAAQGMDAHPSHHVLRLPLTAGERAIGSLSLVLEGGAPGAAERAMFDSAAKQLGSSLERACLYARMEALVVERTEALRSERNRLSAVVDTAGALVLLAEPDGRVVMFNRACEEALGWKAVEAIGRPCWEVVRRVGDELVVRRLFQGLDSGRSMRTGRIQGEWHTRDGKSRSIIWTATALYRADGSLEYVLGTGIDATELRGAEERLRYVSNFDTLTGLPNRMLLRDRLRQMKGQAQASRQVLGFMLLGLGRMPLIREALGPAAEQALVQEVAARLQAASGFDAVGRWSDGTFALCALRGTAEDLAHTARRLLQAVGAPYSYEGEELHLDPCVGIAVYPNDGMVYEVLVKGAESALRQAADGGNQRYCFYRPELNRGGNDRFKMESALRRAIQQDELVLYYQPQVDLASGRIVGAEALLRWRHPQQGLVTPGCFIGLAEESGLIGAIGDWVLAQACAQLAAWRDAGLPLVPVSVNLSAHQFDDQIVGKVGRALAGCGIAPHLLELELTESASMADPGKSCALLGELKNMGIRLAIDDFGTGYSNLNYLKRFPVDKLKLDQSFVRDILDSADDLAISRAVIGMAHGLRLTVVAEGVETAGQLEMLASLGCDIMQGYYFSRPVPAADFGRLLRDGACLETVLTSRCTRS